MTLLLSLSKALRFAAAPAREVSAAWVVAALGGSVLSGCEHHKRYVDAAFDPIFLAADRSGVAEVADPNLVNPIGMQLSPNANFWVANAGTGIATIYAPDGTPLPTSAPLAVHLPVPSGAGMGTHANPTGIVYYGGGGLKIQSGANQDTARYLFATLEGTILGYNSSVDQDNAVIVVDNSAKGAVYRGIAAAARTNSGAYVYVTNFSAGSVDVFNEDFAPATDLDPAAFEDQELPPGFAPFGILRLDGTLFVSYAERGSDGRSPVAGEGKGYIDAFGLNGHYLGRVASEGELDAPWGMAVSPWSFPYFGSALVVGNAGNGRVNVFSVTDGTPLGPLLTSSRAPVAVDGLWDLSFGYDLDGYVQLFFTAAPNGGANGTFGMLVSTLVDRAHD